MAGWLDSKIMQILEGGLDGLSVRNKVLADNIANNDTPNFKRSDLDFNNFLQNALGASTPGQIELKRTSPLHLQGIAGQAGGYIIQDQSTTFRNDGNNVDIDQEMTKLAENTLQYNALTRALSTQLGIYKQAVQG